MRYYNRTRMRLNINTIMEEGTQRFINPSSISLAPGYQIEVFAMGLDSPSAMTFDINGNLLIAESDHVTGVSKILILRNGRIETFAESLQSPISGLSYYRGNLYISHKGSINMIKPDGTRQNVISGLPSGGDYGNSNVAFSSDGKMYIGQGTVTNSGVVGTDNGWVPHHPFLHDSPGSYIMLNGQNFESKNIMVSGNELAYTGAFSAFGETNIRYEIRKGVTKASGCILRCNPDGTEIEMVAWGLRNPSRIRFDQNDRLYAANQGYEIRGSRPIAFAPDEFVQIQPDIWYGWPDFAGGEPVIDPRFWPEGEKPVEFLLVNHPNIPPKPFAVFPSFSYIMGFDFNYSSFAPYGNVFIAEFGNAGHTINGLAAPYAGYGHRISQIDMGSGAVTTFAMNKSGFSASITRDGGLGRPMEVLFGPDHAMYVLDMGLNTLNNPSIYIPNTGVIWRISKI